MKIADTARTWALAACAAGAMLAASQASAAAPSDAQKAYAVERAACTAKSGEDRATCLREAGAALAEARRGRLTDDSSQFERNKLARCDKQPPEDRPDCLRRMNGEGIVKGSVQEGGIYRELRRPVDPVTGN
jgi:hypothetical protein